jgi:hypothetical protein
VLITSVLHILDQREFETKVSPPNAAAGQFRVALSESGEEKPVSAEKRATGEKPKEAAGLARPAVPQEPLFTTLPSQKAVDEFLRAMEEARAKAKSRSVDIFE